MADVDDSQTSPKTIYAFLDTNILIHFPFLNEIDWVSTLNVDKVCLVLSPMVFEELDDIKDGMKKPGRRNLALRVSKFVTSLLDPVPPDTLVDLPGCKNTSLMSVPEDNLFIDPRLREEKQDDHLLAAMLHFRKANPTANLLLVSDDFNCRQRAKRFSLIPRNLPEELKRPLPRTEEEERLKRLEARLPQVTIECGVEGDLLELRYTTQRARLDELDKVSTTRIRAVFTEVKQEFAHVKDPFRGSGDYSAPPPFRRLRTTSPGRFSDEDKTLTRVAEELDLPLLAGYLVPEPRIKLMPDNVPTPESRKPYDAWQANLAKLRELAAEHENTLYYSEQDLEYHALPITLKHTGGEGVTSGQVTVTLEEPLEFRFSKPGGRDTWNDVVHPFTTRWVEKPDRPSAVRTTPHVKVHMFETLYPGSAIQCDTLYLYVASPGDAFRSGAEPRVTIEVSGLSILESVQKVFRVRWV